MDDIKQKAWHRPNLKPWRDPSNGTNKQEIWHTHSENFEPLVLKKTKLVAFL